MRHHKTMKYEVIRVTSFLCLIRGIILVGGMLLVIPVKGAFSLGVFNPEMKTYALVESNMIRLSDVFAHIGPLGYAEVEPSPLPGKQMIRDREWVRRLAAHHGLNWDSSTAPQTIIIERAGRGIPADSIENRLAEALSIRRPESHFDLEMDRNSDTLFAPIDRGKTNIDLPGSLFVRQLKIDDLKGRFSAEVGLREGDHQQVISVKGSLYPVEKVPVLRHAIKSGQVIAASDLQWIERRRRTIGRDVLLSSQGIIGMTVRRHIRAGHPLTASDLVAPDLVKRGDEVSIIFRSEHMVLSARGRARENGVLGETIKVENIQSRRPIFAVVEAPHLVSVTPALQGDLGRQAHSASPVSPAIR